MALKTISITEEVYELLKNTKLPHECFGDVIKRLCEEKTAKSLVQWIQKEELWSNMDLNDFNEVENSILSSKKNFTPYEGNLE
jgi:predicted CopG family antitoxin